MKYSLFFYLLTSTLLITSCNNSQQKPTEQLSPSATSPIVGGVVVAPNDLEALSTVTLYRSKEESFCSGVLIHKRFILTAAHCVEENNNTAFYVGFGLKVAGLHPNANVKFIRPIAAKTHPNYAARRIADIAVLLLPEDAPDDFQPVEMSTLKSDVKLGQVISIAGYGKTSDEPVMSDQLRKTTVEINNQLDRLETHYFFKFTNIGLGACHGDSGGPAYIKDGNKLKLLGIIYAGDRSGSCFTSDGYVLSVPHMHDWITATMKKISDKYGL
ncbi:MAG: serine protease [Bdellovibrionota bacterium]